MKSKIISPTNYFEFLCKDLIDYGRQVTILETPKEKNGSWTTHLIDPEFNKKEIQVNSAEVPRGNVIVLRRSANSTEYFSHYAVRVDVLDELAEKLEEEIFHMLSDLDLEVNA